MNARIERTVTVAVAVHVVVVVAFLVAVAAGGGLRTLCALGGGVLVTVAWIGWTRSVVVEAQLRQPPRPMVTGPPVALVAAPDPPAVRHVPHAG